MHRIITLCIISVFALTNAYSLSVKDKIDAIINDLSKKYPVKFIYDSIPPASWDGVHYLLPDESDSKNLLCFLEIFTKEFNKYPVSFIKKIDLKYVAIVKKLNFKGQHRAALPDAYKEIIFYDILRGRCDSLWTGVRDKYYMVHTIHHEIYHMAEEEINGNFYFKDSVWGTFNDSTFVYGDGGASFYPDMKKKQQRKRKMFTKLPFEVTHPTLGLTTIYASTALEEDKCEIFASFFISKETHKVNRLMKRDPIICRKVKYLKDFLYSVCDEMNEDYWKSLF